MPLKSVFPDIDLPEGITLSEYVLNGPASQNPMSSALIDSETGEIWTFDHVKQNSMAISAALHILGVKKGDMVAVCLPNCMEFVSILIGITSRGAVHCAINPNYTQSEFEYHLSHSTAKFVFVSEESIRNVNAAARKLGLNLDSVPSGSKSYQALLAMGQSEHAPLVKIDPNLDPAVMIYSSGTTACPKGVVRSHASFINSRELVFNHALYDMPEKGDHILGISGMFHVMAVMNSAKAVSAGYPLIVMPEYGGEKMLMLIDKYKVPLLFCGPPVVIFLAKDKTVSKYDLGSLRGLISFSAPLGKELTEEVMIRLPQIKIVTQGYGLTETAPIFYSPKWNAKPGSVGMLVPNNICKIVNVDTGEECGPNEPGEICVKTPTIFLGYFRDEKATAEMFDEDGWFHTGDVAYYDHDQYFFIVDRIKDMIKVRSWGISPAAIEDVLLSHPDIADAAVIGVPDPLADEQAKAFLVKKPGSTVTEEKINEFLNERVISYKRLTGGIEFIDSIPKSPVGKILRRVLQQRENEKQKP